MKRIGLIVVALALAVAGLSNADGRGRAFYGYCSQNHYAATDYGHNYQAHQNYHDTVYVPKAVQVYAAPDYYFSVSDYYRDNLLADAIAYRILVGGAKIPAPVPAPVIPAPVIPAPVIPAPVVPAPAPVDPPKQKAAAPISTPVPAALVKYSNENCLKCHNGPTAKAGLDLTSLATIPADARWAIHGMTSSGEMPKGGQPAPDDVVKLMYDWAKAGKGKVGVTMPFAAGQ